MEGKVKVKVKDEEKWRMNWKTHLILINLITLPLLIITLIQPPFFNQPTDVEVA